MDNEILQNFIDDWLKGVQEIADDIAPDPDADNSMLSLASLPYRFDTYAYASYSTNRISDGYDRASYGWGLQDWLCKFRVTLYNNTLVIPTVNFMGRHHGDSWQWFTNAEIELLQSKFEEILNKGFEVLNNYPTSDILIKYTSPRIITFQPALHSESDITVKAPIKNNEYLYTAKTGVNFQYSDSPVTEEDGTITVNYGSVTASNGWQISSKGYVLMVLDSDADAYNLVSNVFSLTSTNNDIINYTKAGSEYKLYYGDNYLIFALSSSNIYNFTDLFTGTKTAADNHNTWFPDSTPIHTPTYDECKYGPPPPPPTEDDDDIDEQDMGVGTNLSGLGGYWLLTKAQLADLHGALDNAPVGFDPLNSFISLMGLGVDVTKVLDATQIQYITPINIRMSDGTAWQTGVEAHIISDNEIVSAFNSDAFRIQRKYNNFLDYSPYATHELFIPMCGWVTLPDIAVDRDIYVTYIPDIESCKCRAVVSVVSNSEDDDGNGCIIAEKDGIMGSDVPFSNVGHSLFVGDAIINGANVAGEAITMAIGAGFTKTGASGKTFRPYEGFTLGGSGTLPGAIGNALVSGNINRTHFMTGNSTKTGFSDGESIIVKSVYHIPDMPENYAHTVGLVCNKTGQLTEFNGFTVCDNPHITFSALEQEKEEIKRLLEEGVILPSGE